MMSLACLRRLATPLTNSSAACFLSAASTRPTHLTRTLHQVAVQEIGDKSEVPLLNNHYKIVSVVKDMNTQSLYPSTFLAHQQNQILISPSWMSNFDYSSRHQCSKVLSSDSSADRISSTTSGNDQKPSKNKPTPEVLKSVSEKILYHLAHFFIHRFDYSLIREDIVFEDRTNGQKLVGIVNYIKMLNFLKIYGHLRFSFVRHSCVNYSTNLETGVVRVRWQISGIGTLRMALLYLPKQLYKHDNLIKEAKIWREGISYYYIDSEGKIYRHIIDNKEEDRDDHPNTLKDKLTDQLKEKVRKLAPKSPNPATF